MIETSLERFQADVIDASMQVPVLLDFWAPWCGPCKTLGPMLEKLEQQYGGRFRLVKVNTEEHQQLAQHFRIRSIPTVYAFVDGRPVDQFMGALPEAQVAEFVAKLIPGKAPSEVEMLIDAGDEASLRRAIQIEPDNAEARVTLAELLIGDDRSDDGLALIAGLPESADTRRLTALVKIGPMSEADLELRLMGLLDSVKGDDDARSEFLECLDLLEDDNPAKIHWRKQLTSRLF